MAWTRVSKKKAASQARTKATAAAPASTAKPKSTGQTKKQAEEIRVAEATPSGNQLKDTKAILAAITTTPEAPAEKTKPVDKAPQPAEGIVIFTCPREVREASGVESAPFYRPTKDMKLEPQHVFAVRCNKKYRDIVAVTNNERTYVRTALLCAEKIFFYRCHGGNPILLLKGFAAVPFAAPVGQRSIDTVKTRTTVIDEPHEETLRIETPLVHEVICTTVLLRDAAALIKLLPNRLLGTTKDSHVPGLAETYFAVTEKDCADLREAKVPFFFMDNILTSRFALRQLSFRCLSDVSATTLVAACCRIQQEYYGATAIVSTHKTIRINLPFDLRPAVIKHIRLLIDKNLGNTKFFTDAPTSAQTCVKRRCRSSSWTTS